MSNGLIPTNRIAPSAGFVFSNPPFCISAAIRCVKKLRPALASFFRISRLRVLLSTTRGMIGPISRHKEIEQRLARTEQQLSLPQRISRYLVRDMTLKVDSKQIPLRTDIDFIAE
jgi:hypothetical protein